MDIGAGLRTALNRIKKQDKLHLIIGSDGLSAAHLSEEKQGGSTLTYAKERPVQMPDRWVRALGNAADIHQTMEPVLTVKGMQAQMFAASLPPATGRQQAGWLTLTASGVRLMPRASSGAVYVSGLHRLSALKRVMTDLSSVTFYMQKNGLPGACLVEAELPGARLSLGLTAESWQGYSGEGSLLSALAHQDVLEDAESVASELIFDSAIDQLRIARRWGMNQNRVQAALAVLAVSGKAGFDAHDRTYFHRELPDDPDRVLKDNPRLTGARRLTDHVKPNGPRQWIVSSKEADYRVSFREDGDAREAECTCTWYLNHQNRRGPCRHILAVQLKEEIK